MCRGATPHELNTAPRSGRKGLFLPSEFNSEIKDLSHHRRLVGTQGAGGRVLPIPTLCHCKAGHRPAPRRQWVCYGGSVIAVPITLGLFKKGSQERLTPPAEVWAVCHPWPRMGIT